MPVDLQLNSIKDFDHRQTTQSHPVTVSEVIELKYTPHWPLAKNLVPRVY